MVEPVQKMPASMSVRLKQLEKDVAEIRTSLIQFSQGVNNAFTQQVAPLANRLDSIEEILSVVIEDIGADVLQARLDARRAAKEEERIAEAKANIAAGLQKGYLKQVEAISPSSLIVGSEAAPNGEVVSAFASFLFRQMRPEAQQALLGKGPGTTHQSGENTFTVTEVYDVNVEVAKSVADESPATEAPKEAA